MANITLSRQIKHLSTPRNIGIIFLGFVLFVLLFFLEYTNGTKHGDLMGSIIYTFAFPLSLTASVLWLITGISKAQQTHIPWHRQRYIAEGLVALSISLLCLVGLLDSLMNNSLPDAVGYLVAGVSVLLILAVILRFAVKYPMHKMQGLVPNSEELRR